MQNESISQLGPLLRQLRQLRSKSQEEVARASDIAHNYYGEIERGKREPARATLLNIARHGLNLTVNQTNLLLRAAGFAPLPQVLSSSEMARLYKIVEAYLNKMAPYPALVVNQFWNVLKWNNQLNSAFGLSLERISAPQRNWLRLLYDGNGPLRNAFVEWDEFSRYQLALFQRSTLGLQSEPEYQALFYNLQKEAGFERAWQESYPGQADLFMGREWAIRVPGALDGGIFRCRLVQTSFDQYSQLLALTFFPVDPATEEILSLLPTE
ncbi:MAG: helix-turn-helix domain-containing protein [Chloroflexi bacterium]|nr:helix-turn-helix domain-containing protein [Chloroflexota bacterium]OJV88901.1 MAG: hypothetical protein BGO39_02670 [Chloroflexi bacterium 54-19]